MSAKHVTMELIPTPSRLFFACLIALGWGMMIANPMQLMVHHPVGMAWEAADFAKALTMWGLMVLAMMVPTLLPMFKAQETLEFDQISKFIFGYVLAWLGFCVAATVLQYSFRSWALINTHDSSTSTWLSALLLFGAGFYQLSQTKQVHLKACKLSLKQLREKGDDKKVFVFTGLNYGTNCIKGCWPMMLTMFVFGLMNLYVMAALTLILIAEKIIPNTIRVATIAGVLFLIAGVGVLLF